MLKSIHSRSLVKMQSPGIQAVTVATASADHTDQSSSKPAKLFQPYGDRCMREQGQNRINRLQKKER
jgi:hypothetical protein